MSLALAAQDASGRSLTYTASGLPAGLSIDPGTGVISGTTPVGQGSSDGSPVTVTVSDGLVSVSQTFNWAVLSVAALDNPGTQTNAEGDAVSLQLNGVGDGVTFSTVGLPGGTEHCQRYRLDLRQHRLRHRRGQRRQLHSHGHG